MVSLTYRANVFYKKQKKKEVATGLSPMKKLKKDKNGYYVNKLKPRSGKPYKKRVGANDLVYARNEGVSVYDQERDYKIKAGRKKVKVKSEEFYHLTKKPNRGDTLPKKEWFKDNDNYQRAKRL